jgi:hypothetical protein
MRRHVLARIAGLFYALNFLLGGLALTLMAKGPTPAAEAITVAAAADYAIVVLLLGRLFEPAGRGLSWAVAAAGLAGSALSVVGPLHLFTSPVNALALFGAYCLGVGLLILRSQLMPRWIGIFLMLGGLSWLTFISPGLAKNLAPYNMAPGAIAELIFTLWLLAVGVRAPASRTSSAGDLNRSVS